MADDDIIAFPPTQAMRQRVAAKPPVQAEAPTVPEPVDRYTQGHEFTQQKWKDFADRAYYIYGSGLYEKAKPRTQKMIDDISYRHFENALRFRGTPAPDRALWNAYPPKSKIDMIKNSEFGNREPGDFNWTNTKDYMAWRTMKTGIDTAKLLFRTKPTEYEKSLGWTETPPTSIVSKTIHDFIDTQDTRLNKEWATEWSGRINDHYALRMAGGLVGFLPTAIGMYATKGLNINPAEVEAIGGVGKWMAANPDLAKMIPVAVRAANGAKDGFVNAMLTGQQDNPFKDMANWAMIEAGTSLGWMAGKHIFGEVSSVVKPYIPYNIAKSYLKMSKIYGIEFIKDSIRQEGPLARDTVTDPLREHNSNVRDTLAQKMFKKNYDEVDSIKRQRINLEILTTIERSNKFPAAVSEEAAAQAMADETEHTANSNPEVTPILTRLEQNSKKFGGRDKVEVAQEEQARTIQAVKEARSKGTGKSKETQSVPVMITKGMIAKLKALGHTQEAIDKMTPSEANDILNKAKSRAAPQAVKPKGPQNPNDPLINNKANVGPGAANRYDPAFVREVWSKWFSQLPVFESPADNLLIRYWMVKNRPGRYTNAERNKIIAAFEATIPNGVDKDEFIAGRIEGMTEHLHKVHETDFLNRFSGLQGKGQAGHIFRSGKYISDDLRDKYDMPKSPWQKDLDSKYDALLKQRAKDASGKFGAPLARLEKAFDVRGRQIQMQINLHELRLDLAEFREQKQIIAEKYKNYVKQAYTVAKSEAERDKFMKAINAWYEKTHPANSKQFEGYIGGESEIQNLIKLTEGKTRFAAQFRVDSKGRQVLWLNPETMQMLNYGLYGERAARVGLGGVSITKDLPRLLEAIERIQYYTPEENVPILKKLARGLLHAFDKAGDEGIVVNVTQPGKGIHTTITGLREELNHSWQRLTGEGYVENHLSPATFDRLYLRVPEQMKAYLGERAYDELPELKVTTVIETGAKLMSDKPSAFGLTVDQATDFLEEYFTAVAERHGSTALEAIDSSIRYAYDVRDRVYERARGIEASQGILPGFQKGGQGGIAPTPATIGRGSP